MAIPTTQSCARHARRQNGLNRKVESVLAAMRAGATLYRVHRPSSVLWALSNGTAITTEVALLITQHAEVVGVGDSLLGPSLSQTWRFIGR